MAYNLINQKFNRLIVISKDGHMGKKVLWLCKCDCGNITHVSTNDLTSGNTKSCGCYSIEKLKNRRTTHHMTNTTLYKIWCGIKQRCYYKKHVAYKNYGQRGIKMSKEWLKFENFYNDMSSSFKEGLSIDRIDNNKGYSKENCKWSTTEEQANNTSRNRIETVHGITDTVANLSKIFNSPKNVVYNRLHNGWDIEKALLKPKQKNQFK